MAPNHTTTAPETDRDARYRPVVADGGFDPTTPQRVAWRALCERLAAEQGDRPYPEIVDLRVPQPVEQPVEARETAHRT